ncbi:MAG: amidase [Dinoroseobacter sp.]|nr:amidase [Dinoroseobacter sp.]
MSRDDLIAKALAQDNRFFFLEDPRTTVPIDRQQDAKGGALQDHLVGVKSNIAVAGQAWTAGIRARSDEIATQDADVVSVFRGAGAAFLSRLTMDEAALGAATEASGWRSTRNPAASDCSVGGSSGGAAAAVACGAVRLALGSDTLGSVRIPAAYCGVLGLKPTRDLLPMGGVFPLAPGFDTLGLLADGTEVVSRVLDLFGVGDAPHEVTVQRALPETEIPTSPEVADAIDHSQVVLSELGLWSGARQVSGWAATDVRMAAYSLVCAKAIETLSEEKPVGKAVTQALRFGARLSSADLSAAQAVCDRAAQGLLDALSDSTVLITPTTPTPPFRRGAKPPPTQADFTAIANLAGVPALAVPISGGAAPLSVQLIGAPGTERALLRLANVLLGADVPTQIRA